jgi:DNA-binding transcriptional regulator LsrR (DeoR family)
MGNFKRLYSEVVELYDQQGLAADEIAAVMAVPEHLVTEMIDDFETSQDEMRGEFRHAVH